MRSIESDVKQAIRGFRRAPTFTATAIGVLALGIGLATAVFTVANAVLLRRLPVVDQDHIVVLYGEAPRKGLDNVPLDYDGAQEFFRFTRTLSRAAYVLYNGASPVTVRELAGTSRLQRALVSGNYFGVLGIRPLLGRTLRPEDDAPGAAPVLVLSHRFWQERFSGATDVLQRQITTLEDGRTYSIVGVMPPGLDFPRGADVWVSLLTAIPQPYTRYASLDIVGRLARGSTPSDAQNEITTFFHRNGTAAFFADVRGVAHTLPELVLGDVRAPLVAFALAAGLLLLITCVNVANLLLVRGLARVREIGIRSALGASRGRLVRQLLTELAVLALAGGALGALIAAALVRGFVAIAPNGIPRLDEIGVSGSMLGAAVATTAIAALLSSITPTLMASRTDLQGALRSDGRQSASRSSRLLSESLVAAQVALAVLVLSAAGILSRSLWRLQRADLAFMPAHVIVAELVLQRDHDQSAANGLIERLLTSIQAMPGILAASPVVSVPYSDTRSWEGRPSAEGQSEEEAAHNPMLDFEVIGPQFFAALGLPVTKGRAFAEADRAGAPQVVMLSEGAAHYYWPNADPIGKRIQRGASPASGFMTVIGVVPDTRYRNLRERRATIYFPLLQSQFPFAPTTLIVRTTRSPGDVAATLRNVAADVAPDVALARVVPFDDLLAGPLAQPRMNALLLILFGLSAVVLASVGLFGILATMVRQRRRELGIRMTLGASPAEVARLVVRRGVLLATLGTVSGMIAALATNRLLTSLLFEVSPSDAVTLGIVATIIGVVALLASAIPARSSSRVDPAIALRAD
ncbi:MAG TPA: ABC transporter permease [Gemmatimonadaceae bacterium]|jgi:predicted permease